jgi:hypothetical protein
MAFGDQWLGCMNQTNNALGLPGPTQIYHGVEEVLHAAHEIHLALSGMEPAEAVEYLVHSGAIPAGMIATATTAGPIAADAAAVALAWYAGTSIGCASTAARREWGDQINEWFIQQLADWGSSYFSGGAVVAVAPPIGQPGHTEQTSLRSSNTAHEDPAPAIPNAPQIQEGCGASYADWTKHLQELLAYRGYDVVADGDFGPRTTEAVKAFQTQAGLSADGIVGESTWAALMS